MNSTRSTGWIDALKASPAAEQILAKSLNVLGKAVHGPVSRNPRRKMVHGLCFACACLLAYFKIELG